MKFKHRTLFVFLILCLSSIFSINGCSNLNSDEITFQQLQDGNLSESSNEFYQDDENDVEVIVKCYEYKFSISFEIIPNSVLLKPIKSNHEYLMTIKSDGIFSSAGENIYFRIIILNKNIIANKIITIYPSEKISVQFGNIKTSYDDVWLDHASLLCEIYDTSTMNKINDVVTWKSVKLTAIDNSGVMHSLMNFGNDPNFDSKYKLYTYTISLNTISIFNDKASNFPESDFSQIVYVQCEVNVQYKSFKKKYENAFHMKAMTPPTQIQITGGQTSINGTSGIPGSVQFNLVFTPQNANKGVVWGITCALKSVAIDQNGLMIWNEQTATSQSIMFKITVMSIVPGYTNIKDVCDGTITIS